MVSGNRYGQEEIFRTSDQEPLGAACINGFPCRTDTFDRVLDIADSTSALHCSEVTPDRQYDAGTTKKAQEREHIA